MLLLPSSTSKILAAGYYFTGDGCRRDSDGYYWITGRVDDVINPSGHRIGTAEIESALVACPQVGGSKSIVLVIKRMKTYFTDKCLLTNMRFADGCTFESILLQYWY